MPEQDYPRAHIERLRALCEATEAQWPSPWVIEPVEQKDGADAFEVVGSFHVTPESWALDDDPPLITVGTQDSALFLQAVAPQRVVDMLDEIERMRRELTAATTYISVLNRRLKDQQS